MLFQKRLLSSHLLFLLLGCKSKLQPSSRDKQELLKGNLRQWILLQSLIPTLNRRICGQNDVFCDNKHEAYKSAYQNLVSYLNNRGNDRVNPKITKFCRGESPNMCCAWWVHPNDNITFSNLAPAAQKAIDTCGSDLVSAKIHNVILAVI
jgi:hypothetical protein